MPWTKDGNKWVIGQSELEALLFAPGGYNHCPTPNCKGKVRMSDTWIENNEDGSVHSKHALCTGCEMEIVVLNDDGKGI